MHPHASRENLALLAEGRLSRSTAREVESHLATCRACYAEYAGAVRLLVDNAPVEGLDADLRGRAQAIAAHPTLLGPVALKPRRLVRFVVPVVAGVLVVAMTLWWMGRREPELSVPEPLLAAVRLASTGGLVLPGGEDWAATAGSTYRAGSGVFLDSLTEALNHWDNEDGGTAERAVWILAGHVAAGRSDLARSYAPLARQRYPKEIRLLILQAVLAYRDSDLESAEALLREALQHEPMDPLARLDLGLVLVERQDYEAARDALQRVVLQVPSSPLGQRARQALAGISVPGN